MLFVHLISRIFWKHSFASKCRRTLKMGSKATYETHNLEYFSLRNRFLIAALMIITLFFDFAITYHDHNDVML